MDHPPKTTGRLVRHNTTGMPAAFASIYPIKTRTAGSPRSTAPQATVFIRNLFADSPEMLVEALGELFQLTPAEARFAAALYDNQDMTKVARLLRISTQTARSRLKIVHDKTGVHGQAALVKMIRELRSVLSDTNEHEPSEIPARRDHI